MASIFDFAKPQKNSPSPGRPGLVSNNPEGLYMSSPLEAARDGGHFMNEIVNDDELPKVYQKMVPNFKHGPKSGNHQKLRRRTRPYEYQTQEKSSFFSDTEDNSGEDELPVNATGQPHPTRSHGGDRKMLTQYEAFEGGVSFPLTKSVLWSRRPLCTPVVVPSGCLVPAMWLSQKALLALGYQKIEVRATGL